MKVVARWSLVGLFCGIACVAEPDEEVLEAEQISEPGQEGDESHEDQFRASYSCILVGEEEEEEEEEEDDDDDIIGGDIYCLAKCKGFKVTRAVKSPVDPKKRGDYWCEYKAKEFCDYFDKDYDSWCWGIKDEDD